MAVVQSWALNDGAGGTANVVVNKPTGTVSGDLLLAVASTFSTAPTFTASGFTVVQNGGNVWFAYKIAGGSEPASYTFTRAVATTGPFAVVLMRITGHDPTTPVGVRAGVSAASGANAAIPSVSAAATGTLLSVLHKQNNVAPTNTQPSGMTKLFDDTALANSATSAATEQVAVGATGTKTWVSSGTGGTNGYGAGHIVIHDAPAVGSATGSHTWTSTATGHRDQHGTSTGSHVWSGAAAGTRHAVGTSTGTHTWTGSAAGSTLRHGAAAGSHSWSGAPAGHRDQHGAASGSHAWDGTASGHRQQSGAAVGADTWGGAAAGHQDPAGAASGSHTWTGTATANAGSSGSATGSHTWASTPTGHTTRSGSATGSSSWTGGAAGHRVTSGSATGSHSWGGSAAGHRHQRGTTAGSVTFTGTPAGTRHARATCVGGHAWGGQAAGTRDPHGTSSGEHAWDAIVHGAERRNITIAVELAPARHSAGLVTATPRRAALRAARHRTRIEEPR